MTKLQCNIVGFMFSLCALAFSADTKAHLSLSLKPCISSDTISTIQIDMASAYICALSERENYFASPKDFLIYSYGDTCPRGFKEVRELKVFTERTFTACTPQDNGAFTRFFDAAQKSSLPIVHWFKGFRCDYGVAELIIEGNSESTSAVGCVVN